MLSLPASKRPCYTSSMSDTKSKRRTIGGIIFAVLFLAITTIIFVFAAQTGDVSSSQSNFVVDLINDTLHLVGITLNTIQLDTLAFITRKLIGHFSIFAIDGAFFLLAFHAFWPAFNKWWTGLISVSGLLVIAIVSEFIQLFTSGRSGNWIDVLIDTSGALLGISIVFSLHYREHTKVS